MGQWNDADKQTGALDSPLSPENGSLFDNAAELHTDDSLDLDMSLHFHLAEDVQSWVGRL